MLHVVAWSRATEQTAAESVSEREILGEIESKREREERGTNHGHVEGSEADEVAADAGDGPRPAAAKKRMQELLAPLSKSTKASTSWNSSEATATQHGDQNYANGNRPVNLSK